MPIETLEDIIEDLANKLGIYGACPDGIGNGLVTPDCKCRCCWTLGLTERIKAAVRIEELLNSGFVR